MAEKLEDKIEALLQRGLNAKDDRGCTALLLACEAGKFELAESLLQKGADVNARNNDGKTPLMVALEKGNVSFAIALISAGANAAVLVNSKHLLTKQFLKEHPELIKMMTNSGANAEILSDVQVASFTDVATDAKALESFVQSGGVPVGSPQVYECAEAAIKVGSSKTLDMLFEQNPMFDVASYRSKDNETFFVITAKSENLDDNAAAEITAKLLMQFEKTCNMQLDNDPKKMAEIDRSILEQGKEITPENRQLEKDKIIKSNLIEVLTEKDNDGNTALSIALQKDNMKTFDYIFENGGKLPEGYVMHDAMKHHILEIYPDKQIEDFYILDSGANKVTKNKATNRHEPLGAKLARMHNMCAEKNPKASPLPANNINLNTPKKNQAFEFVAAQKSAARKFEL